MYVSFCRSGITASQAAPLIGFNERNNRHNGYMGSIPKGMEIACGAKPLAIACGLPPLPLSIAGPVGSDADAPAMLEFVDNIGKMPSRHGGGDRRFKE